MKTTLTTLLFSVMITMGCSDDSDTIDGDVSIMGKWQMTERYVSPGGETEWKEVKDGEIHYFKTDSTFTSNGMDCPEGDFSVQGDSLLLDFNCNYSAEPQVMRFYFEGGDLILTPLSPVFCIEACLYRFEKID